MQPSREDALNAELARLPGLSHAQLKARWLELYGKPLKGARRKLLILGISYRLQELTSLRVNPEPAIVELTDPKIQDYPWIYIVEPGEMELTDEEVAGLRKYLLNGGFLMVDDFWGDSEWENFYREIRRVFPDREPQELPLDHPLFPVLWEAT